MLQFFVSSILGSPFHVQVFNFIKIISFHVEAFSCSQITTLPEEFPEAYSVANKLRVEYVIAVEGVVRSRPAESLNAKMRTGAIEVLCVSDFFLNLICNFYGKSH